MDLRLVYRNQAAAEFCAFVATDVEVRASLKKGSAPPEVLDRCRLLKKRWETADSARLCACNPDETVHHPTRRDLRVDFSVNNQLGCRPRLAFLIESRIYVQVRNGISNQGASLSH